MVAGETLGSVFPISVSFVQGEQPADGKFSGWANQTEAGLTRLAKGVGDLWGEEFDSGNKLYVATHRPPHIMNLARLIGPASAINPMRPVSTGSGVPSGRVEYDIELDPDDIPIGVNEFNLRDIGSGYEPPIDYDAAYPLGAMEVHDSIETVLEYISTTAVDTVFVTRVSSRTLVNGSGDYYVDTHGNVLTYDITGDYNAISPSASTTYQTVMAPDMYDQATYNVIPDMNQSTSDGLCDVLSNSEDSAIPAGEYVIRTPYITKLPRIDAFGNDLEPGDDGCPPASFATTERARLPYALKAASGMNLSDGDVIPDGFIGLWEEGVGMVQGLTFKLSNVTAVTDPDGFDSDYCVIATGGTLTTNAVSPAKGSTYRLITVGTTITELLAYLVRRVDTHTHNTRQGGYPVEHRNLKDKHIAPTEVSADWGITVRSPPSVIAINDHPQYLCRYGWKASIDAGQYDNAMLGDIFLAAVQSSYLTDSYDDSGQSSRRLYLGSSDRYIYYNGASNWLSIVPESSGGTVTMYGTQLNLGNPAFGGGAGYETMTIKFYHGSTDNASLVWDETSQFYLEDGGDVGDSLLQLGELLIHGEDDALDPTSLPTDKRYVLVDTGSGVSRFSFYNETNELTYIEQTTDNFNIHATHQNIEISTYTLGGITIDSVGQLNLSGDTWILMSTLGNLQATAGGYAQIEASGLIKLDAGTTLDLEADGNITIDNSNLASGVITLKTDTAGPSYGYVDFDCGYVILPMLDAPSLPTTEGLMYYDTNNDRIYVRTGSAWKQIAWV